MSNLQYGDKLDFNNCHQNLFQINEIIDVAPIKFDTIEESWVVCSQNDATHMFMVMDTSINVDSHGVKYAMIEIGKCINIYLLADVIVG